MLKYSGLVKTLLTTVLVLIAGIDQIARAQTHEFSPPLRATQLMGLKVEDTDGRKVGTVRNLILDARTGQIKFAVIGSGGFIGVRSELRLAPAQIMSAATTKRETLSINTTLNRWKGAPTFSRSQLAFLAYPDESERIALYFVKSDSRASGTSGTPLRVSSRQTNASPGALKLASDLIGKTVVNRQRQKLGEVVDLLVGFGRTHVAFAIVSTGKFVWRGREYAVPVQVLSPGESNSRLMVDADTATLQKAPPFDQKVWDADGLANPAVFSYSKSQE